MMQRELRLNGVEVSTSFLTQRSYRAASCDLLLQVTPETQEEALEELERVGEFGPYSGLSISGIKDLEFLANFPSLLYLEIRGPAPLRAGCLDGLENLRGLYLEEPKSGIDFARFPLLERYVGGWHPDHRNLAGCRELRSLRLWAFNPPSGDLAPLAGILRLEELEINQTQIDSLAGMERLEDLRYLTVSRASRLESLDALAACAGLRELSMSGAKRIRSYLPLARLPRLRQLKLTGCTPMESLAWTAGMEHLDFFSFVDTDVRDGDLTPLLQLPRLRYAGSMNRRHYTPRIDALNAELNRLRG